MTPAVYGFTCLLRGYQDLTITALRCVGWEPPHSSVLARCWHGFSDVFSVPLKDFVEIGYACGDWIEKSHGKGLAAEHIHQQSTSLGVCSPARAGTALVIRQPASCWVSPPLAMCWWAMAPSSCRCILGVYSVFYSRLTVEKGVWKGARKSLSEGMKSGVRTVNKDPDRREVLARARPFRPTRQHRDFPGIPVSLAERTCAFPRQLVDG